MTTIEKKLADTYFKNKCLEVLNLLNGSDFAEAHDILAAVELLLKKNCVFDFSDSEHNITSFLEDISDNIKD